jgi:1-aminocyclopropane-1-carboxylate deaminase/D-cysteine desulfhydrase-like pyridoxal-dependent ACC family enzyme
MAGRDRWSYDASVFDHLPRASLATLPTALEAAGRAGRDGAEGPRLWIKRDDLTGLGGGGNKARKLEFICGEAVSNGAGSLVTVGAAQSNHCRMTAAAGSRLGLEVHLVLSGDQPARPTGNQLLSTMFGAQMHFTGAAASHWGELEIAREALTDELADHGMAPCSIPIGGSTPLGAVGYALAFVELIEQCAAAGFVPAAIVFTSSSGGTHAGLLAGRAALIARGRLEPGTAPAVVAVGVAKGVTLGAPDPAALADAALDLMGIDTAVDPNDVEVDARWLGDDYGVPTAAGAAAIDWAARRGGWITDPVYSGKGLSGLLGMIDEGRWSPGDDVVFIHTGGWPSLFA